MTTIKNVLTGLSTMFLSTFNFAQTGTLNAMHNNEILNFSDRSQFILTEPISTDFEFKFDQGTCNQSLFQDQIGETNIDISSMGHADSDIKAFKPHDNHSPNLSFNQPGIGNNMGDVKPPFFKNRPNVYSSMWAFASLNYLYADLVGLMDANVLAQYQNGVVEGTKITPNFLTVAAGFMQIPIANVFLPHLIKNERTLRWVQITSGTIMTLVQSATLFVGKPTPYYALFSAFEIAATTYITIDAIKWKPNNNKPKRGLE